MSVQAVVALDQGTSSSRAALFREGRLVAEARREVELVFPGPGRVEQDPRLLYEASLAVLEEVLAHLADGETAALGITNQRSTVILWDAETGKPFGPALSWRDSRARDEAEALQLAESDLEVRTGLPSSPHYGAPKITWALSNWPAARAAADSGRLRVGPVGTWLVWKLTRGESFAVDPTNAQRLNLLDLETLDWHASLVEACSLPLEALPALRPTDGHFGEAIVAGRRLPIRAMLGDQQAALLALTGGAEPGESAAIHLGTGGFVLRDVGAEYRAVPGLLGGLARADANRARRYLVEGPVNSAGSAFDRLKDLGLLGEGENIDELCRKSARPLTIVPAWAGLAAPWWEPGARAALSGWDESSTRADVVAGTLRGIAFLVADILDRMRQHELAVDTVLLSGPLAAIASLGQAIADASGIVARIRSNPEASLEGIAALTAWACELEPPTLSTVEGREFRPGPPPTAERAAFDAARAAVISLARASTEGP